MGRKGHANHTTKATFISQLVSKIHYFEAMDHLYGFII